MTTPHRPQPTEENKNIWLFAVIFFFLLLLLSFVVSPFLCLAIIFFAGISFIGWQVVKFAINTLASLENTNHGLNADLLTHAIQTLSNTIANLPHSNQTLALWGFLCFIMILVLAVPIALGW